MTIFDQVIADFTGGLIADVQCAVLAALSIALLVFGVKLLIERGLGHSIETELEYREYKRKLDKKEYFESRYQKEYLSRKDY